MGPDAFTDVAFFMLFSCPVVQPHNTAPAI
jgi:hypothetical protein